MLAAAGLTPLRAGAEGEEVSGVLDSRTLPRMEALAADRAEPRYQRLFPARRGSGHTCPELAETRKGLLSPVLGLVALAGQAPRLITAWPAAMAEVVEVEVR